MALKKILEDILQEDRIDELGSGRDAIKKALRGLDELLGNCVSMLKQLPDYQKFKSDSGDYMDAVGLLCANLSNAEKTRCKNDVVDALNVVFSMLEKRDKFKVAKQTVGNLIYHFNNNYQKD